MLLGNHDLSYYRRDEKDNWNVFANRIDVFNYKKLCTVFIENQDLFKIIDIFEMPESKQFFLFSHAGVQDEWISSNNLIDGFDVNKTDALTIYNTLTTAEFITPSTSRNNIFIFTQNHFSGNLPCSNQIIRFTFFNQINQEIHDTCQFLGGRRH